MGLNTLVLNNSVLVFLRVGWVGVWVCFWSTNPGNNCRNKKRWIFETEDIQTFSLWLQNDMNSFPSVEYFRTKFKYSATWESLPMFSINQNLPRLHYSSSTTSQQKSLQYFDKECPEIECEKTRPPHSSLSHKKNITKCWKSSSALLTVNSKPIPGQGWGGGKDG